jgi:hypothetical protein
VLLACFTNTDAVVITGGGPCPHRIRSDTTSVDSTTTAPPRTAELPKIGGGSLIAMNEVIKVELVDLAAVELREAVTYPLKECAKLGAVIRPNQLTRGTP